MSVNACTLVLMSMMTRMKRMKSLLLCQMLSGKSGDYYRLINALISDKVKDAYAQRGQHTDRAARDSALGPLLP